jgi:hypothetical protein
MLEEMESVSYRKPMGDGFLLTHFSNRDGCDIDAQQTDVKWGRSTPYQSSENLILDSISAPCIMQYDSLKLG